MDYFGIIKKSYEITLKNKFLWIFGIFIGTGFGIFQGFNYMFDIPEVGDISPTTITTIAILVCVLTPIALVFNYTSQAALIKAYANIENDNKSDFKKELYAGFEQFWRILLLNILTFIAVFFSILLIAVPVGLLIWAKTYILAATLGILLLLVVIFFWIVVGLVYPYCLRMIVLEDIKVTKAIRKSLHMVRDNFIHVFLMYLSAYLINYLVGFVLFFCVILVGLLLFVIGYGIYLASPETAIFYAFLMGFAFLLIMMIASGAYMSFNSGLFTLTYLKIKKLT
jgi:hypothetical protein